MSDDTRPEDLDPDPMLDEWLRTHEQATSGQTEQYERPERIATQTVERAPVWDPERGSWVEAAESPASTKTRKFRLGSRTWMLPAIAGGVVGAIVAAAVAIPVARMAAPDAAPVTQNRVAPLTPSSGGRTSSIVDIAARARPWVVNINVGTSQTTAFGDVQVSGTGSGVILRSDGHILTNAHVVEGARSIEVTLASGDNLNATLVGSDPETDVAVVKVDRNDLPAAVIGSVKDLEVGQTAVAIGSPLGLEQSVTSGIISALGRRVERDTQSPLFDMIQTDAAVTQGNSGGALIDSSGAVVGINSAIAASPEVGAEGIAFAIPIDVAIAVAEELINSGRATHPWLGIAGGNITGEAADQFDVTKGAFVSSVVSGGPADKAGIRPNDIVASIDGEEVETMDDLIVAIRQRRVGQSVELVVVRDGRRLTLDATLGDKPNDVS